MSVNKLAFSQALIQIAKIIAMFGGKYVSYLPLLMTDMIVLTKYKQYITVENDVRVFVITQIVCNIIDVLSISVFFHGIFDNTIIFMLYFIAIILNAIQRCYKATLATHISLAQQIV